MTKRGYFESMRLAQLEGELEKLNRIQGRLHREQRKHRTWIEEIISEKQEKERKRQEQMKRKEIEELPDKINAEHAQHWRLFMDNMIAKRNARLAARTDDGAKDHVPWRTDNIIWYGQADMQVGLPEQDAEHGQQVFVLADESNFRHVRDIITDSIPLALTKFTKGRNHGPIAVVKDVPLTDEWKEVMLSGLMSTNDYAALTRKSGVPDQIKQAFDLAHVMALMGEEDAMEHLKSVASAAIAKHGIRTTQQLFEASNIPHVWAFLERELDSHITLSPPRSAEEAYLRISTQYRLLAHAAQNVGSQQVASLHDNLVERRMARIPQRTSIDPANVPTELTHIDPSIFALPGLTTAMESGKNIYLCKKDMFDAALASSSLMLGRTDNPLVTRERLAALLPDEPHDEKTGKEWVSGYFPTPEVVALNRMHKEIDAEFARMKARTTTIDFTPDETTVLHQMIAQIDSFQWRDREQDTPDPTKTGVRFENDQNKGDCWIANAPQHEFFLRRDPRHPAWIMRSILGLVHIDIMGKDSEEIWKTTMAILNKLYPVRLIPQFDPNTSPTSFIREVVSATRAVTREYPRSPHEAADRIVRACHSWPSANATKQCFVDMKPTRIEDQEHAWLREHLEMLDPALLAPNPNVIYTLGWGATKAQFVCRKEHLPQSLAQFVTSDNEETLDLVVNLNLHDEYTLESDAWVSGTLPSIEELEKDLLTQDFVFNKFFPNTKDDTPPSNESALPNATDESSRAEPKPIPRTKQLRNVLLKNRWKATFTVDDRTTAPSHAQYASAEPGHYVLVSLPDAKLQLIISDDHSKGTFVLRNLIDPTHFTEIGIDELLASYGATRVKFSSVAQFRSALETEIREQIKDPITIYPVASNYPTPLDTYPNPDATTALRRDFEMAASNAGKQSIDDLTVADFSRIKSGPLRWSFGGVAGGAAYLDRLATEFGLDASALNARATRRLNEFIKMEPSGDQSNEQSYADELTRLQDVASTPLEQYEYRERILRLILWDLSETYRRQRSAMYEERDRHGHYHSLATKSRRGNRAESNEQ